MSNPHGDPEKNREYDRRRAADPARRAANREATRRYRQRHPENGRQWREANKEEIARKKREYQAANREKSREAERRYRERHPDRVRERAAQYRAANQGQIRARYAAQTHGPDVQEAFIAMWEQQHGRCYLCGEILIRDKAVIDHDHSCCPAGRSCPACRRGLACHRCNRLIGHVNDDPDLLRKIAGNLEREMGTARARIAGKPHQDDLFDFGMVTP